MFFFPFRDIKELEICRIAAIKAQIGTLICRLYEVDLAENRNGVLVWQCFRDHCTANMLVVQSVLTLSIYSTYFSCQYVFEGTVTFFGMFVQSGIYSLKHRTFAVAVIV